MMNILTVIIIIVVIVIVFDSIRFLSVLLLF